MTPHRARFLRWEVHATDSSPLRLDCTIENASQATWSETPSAEASLPASSASVVGPVWLSYQVFDAPTGRLVLDGQRWSLGGQCQPGQRCERSVEIQLPPEEGLYQVVISPVWEGKGWFYEHGSQFLELEVSCSSQGVRVRKVRRTTRYQRQFRRLGQFLLRSFWYPTHTITRYRSLIVSMVRRDIQGRYRGSMGGATWTLVHPLLLMAVYYFVFAVVLRVRFGVEQGSAGFVFYFLCGMLPWLGFSEAVGRSPNIVLEHSNFVKRVVFPLEILPINLTLTGLATEAFALVIFLAALVVLGNGLHWTALYLPVILVPQILLTVGLCWFLAALGVFLRDTGQMMGLVLTIWFFITPIVYPASALPEGWLWLFEINPMYTIVGAYRAVFLERSPPPVGPLAILWGVALGMFWLGYGWFYKMKRAFADLI
ncbi:MAG: ABC transporter permease [Acidobacteria bacterium]|nr:ABC transporter permease [Acidobacteriota bacterium]